MKKGKGMWDLPSLDHTKTLPVETLPLRIYRFNTIPIKIPVTISCRNLTVVVVQSFSCVQLFAARLPCPSLFPEVCSNSCALSQWCHPIISSSVAPFSSCPQSFPASGTFPVSWLFASGGKRTGASASVLPMNIQCWSPWGLTGLISLVQGTPTSLLQHHSWKASIFQHLAFFMV